MWYLSAPEGYSTFFLCLFEDIPSCTGLWFLFKYKWGCTCWNLSIRFIIKLIILVSMNSHSSVMLNSVPLNCFLYVGHIMTGCDNLVQSKVACGTVVSSFLLACGVSHKWVFSPVLFLSTTLRTQTTFHLAISLVSLPRWAWAPQLLIPVVFHMYWMLVHATM
jgi:hypothetical protein